MQVEQITEYLLRLVMGVAAGAGWALNGWAKNKDEPIDWVVFFRTVFFGGFVGLTGTLFNMSFDSVVELLKTFTLDIGIIGAIETFFKAIVRRTGIDKYVERLKVVPY